MDRRPICVLVAADSEVAAARLESILRADPERRVRLGPARALGQLVEEHGPALVVLASTASRALAFVRAAAEQVPLPGVVLLVDDPRAAWTAAARRAGVRAVLDRDAGPEELTAAVTAALAGLITLHPDVFRPTTPAPLAGGAAERALTARELEILEMLAEGLRNQAIARRLRVSTFTVKFHVASILDKLRAGSRTEAVSLGIRRGLISL